MGQTSVAQSSQATQTARVTGFLIAAMELTDNVEFDLREILASSAPSACQLLASSTSLRVRAGTALPAGAVAQVGVAAKSVLRDASTPVALANAARCAETVTELPSVATRP